MLSLLLNSFALPSINLLVTVAGLLVLLSIHPVIAQDSAENSVGSLQPVASPFIQEIKELGIKDPKAAVLFALKKKKEGNPEIVFPESFATQWCRNDPKDFIRWASTLNKDDFDKANKCPLWRQKPTPYFPPKEIFWRVVGFEVGPFLI